MNNNCNVEDRTDHNGKVYDSIIDMCNNHNIKPTTYYGRLKLGWSKEDALTKTTETGKSKLSIEERTDHKGVVYKSVKDMCKKHGVCYVTYLQKIKDGYSKEDILTKPCRRRYNNIEDRTDHNGVVHESFKIMCEKHNVAYSTARNKKRLGLPIEKILEPSKTKNFSSIEERTDHNGVVYKSKAAMCEKYGITLMIYNNREQTGWSKEKILTTPIYENRSFVDIEKRTDHNGVVYKSIKDMCKNHKVTYQTYSKRINSGLSKKDALTTPPSHVHICPLEDRTDHNGVVYKSKAAMCEKYGITANTYDGRKKLGMSKEEILMTPTIKTFLDPISNEYLTIRQLEEKYNMSSRNALRSLLNKDYTITQCLKISFPFPKFQININYSIYDLTIDKRIKKGENVFECYIDNGDGTSTFRIMNQEMIDEYCIQKYKEEHGIT